MAEAFVDLLLAPINAGRTIELGWVDRVMVERYAEGIRTHGKQPATLPSVPVECPLADAG
jgi:hypothetical protein